MERWPFAQLGVNTAEKGALAAGQGPADPLTDARLLEDVQFSMLKRPALQGVMPDAEGRCPDEDTSVPRHRNRAVEVSVWLVDAASSRSRSASLQYASLPGHAPPSNQLPVDCATVLGISASQPRWPGQTGAGLNQRFEAN